MTTSYLPKTSRDPIEYAELRILAVLKNKNFSYKKFKENYEMFISEPYQCTADYSLLQVMEIFRIFVCDALEIDQLIRIHKYCCDTWKMDLSTYIFIHYIIRNMQWH